jgi:predicted Zn-dependent protease
MKSKSINQLVADLDKVFSIFIRLRDIDDEGFSYCVTCGKPMTLKTSQCGHFISRRHFATRWEEKNCAAQCVGCNIYTQGKQYEFGLAIDERFGVGTAQKLLIQSKNKFKKDKAILQILINKYK